MGIYPPYWGPCAWVFLHTVGHEYARKKNANTLTDSDKEVYRKFVNVTLPKMLPCSKCRKNFASYVDTQPWTSATELDVWLYNAHKHKREEQNKPSFTTISDFRQAFEDKRCARTDQGSAHYGDGKAIWSPQQTQICNRFYVYEYGVPLVVMTMSLVAFVVTAYRC